MTKATNRPKRVPLAEQQRTVLSSEQRKGYVRRWVNEEDNRIEKFLLAGYTPVEGKEDNNVKRAQDGTRMGSVARKTVNRDSKAAYHTAILMEIPEDLYREDQEVKARLQAEQESAMDPATKKQDGADYGSMSRK